VPGQGLSSCITLLRMLLSAGVLPAAMACRHSCTMPCTCALPTTATAVRTRPKGLKHPSPMPAYTCERGGCCTDLAKAPRWSLQQQLSPTKDAPAQGAALHLC
jgi:hypothetical protein